MVGMCMCATSWRDIGVAFNIDLARIFSTVTFETYFSRCKAIWITVTDYYIYFNQIVVSPLIAIHQLIN